MAELTEEEKEQEALNQFYTLIFMSNPMTSYIKIWIPSEDMTLYMKQSKFVNLMADLIGIDFKYKLEYACMEYGGFYFIDRQKKEIKSLSMTAQDKRVTAREMYAAAMEENPWLSSSSNTYTENKLFDDIGKPTTENLLKRPIVRNLFDKLKR